MIESMRENWLMAAIGTVAILGLLWYPDFTGYHHTHLSFLLPYAGKHFEGVLFDSIEYKIMTVAMAVMNGFALLVLSVRYLSLGKANTMLPFFYFLLIFAYPQAHAFSPAFLSALFVILGLCALFESGNGKRRMAPLFISSFLIGCACLLYLSAWIVVASFIVMATVLHIFSGRNIIVFAGGILTTLGGCLLYRHLFFGDVSGFLETWHNSTHNLHLQLVSRVPATSFMTLVLIYLLGRAIARWLRHSRGNQSYKYRAFASFIWMLVICGVPLIFLADTLFGYLPVMAIPASILLTHYFSKDRISKQMKAEFAVLMLAVALNQVAYYI